MGRKTVTNTSTKGQRERGAGRAGERSKSAMMQTYGLLATDGGACAGALPRTPTLRVDEASARHGMRIYAQISQDLTLEAQQWIRIAAGISREIPTSDSPQVLHRHRGAAEQ